MQGRVDVKFKVKGTRESGWCRFRARRVGGKGGTVSCTRQMWWVVGV